VNKGVNFLIITDSIDVNDSSGSKANVAIIKNLLDLGHNISVLHYTKKNIDLNGIHCINIKERRNSLMFLLSRFQRVITRHFNIDIHKYLENTFGFSFTYFNDSKSISKAIVTHYNNEDFVITLSKGASFRPHYVMLSHPQLHKKWLAYIHDPYPFSYYPKPYDWNEPGYKQKIKFFKKVAKTCKWVAYPSLLLQEWMEGKFESFKGKGIVIPHQIETIRTIETQLPNYFKPSKFNLLHAGNLMKQRDPFPLIQAFKLFLDAVPEAENTARLFLIGSASYHEKEIWPQIKNTEQIHLSRGYVGYDEVLAMQKNTSVNIILEAIGKISPFLPGKFPHCIIANKPILLLGPTKSETRRLLGDNYPYYAQANDVQHIKKQICALYANWTIDRLQELDRPDIEQYLSKEHLARVITHIHKS